MSVKLPESWSKNDIEKLRGICVLALQGYEPCNCFIEYEGKLWRPCELGIKYESGRWYRRIYAIELSRPEDYLSVYQSCCNHDCKMCHSWYFSRRVAGEWYSIDDIVVEAKRYLEIVTVWEPRERATMWHASDLCMHCGMCVTRGVRGSLCPGKLEPWQVVLSLQGWGPARNIISFTGGDLYCRVDFYEQLFKRLKEEVPKLWVKIETNGYGLTEENLRRYAEAGLDSIWLDLKAYREDVYKWLTGTTNKWVLRVPELALKYDLVLEIVLLYIPGVVEVDQIREFGKYIASIDPDIPTMLIAYFPEYRLNTRPPTVIEMIQGYLALKEAGLRKVKVGNLGVFCKTKEDWDLLLSVIEREALG